MADQICLVRRIDSRGFTLLELLLAIFIFSIVISTVYGSYRTTFHNVQGSEQQAAIEGRARILLERLTADLESVYAGTGGFLYGEREDIGEFVGARLSFTSTAHLKLHQKAADTGLTNLTYTTKENSETGLMDIYRLDQPLLPGAADGLEAEDNGELIGAGVKEFVVTYLSRDGADSESWKSDGDSDQEATPDEINLPAMVKVEVRFGEVETDSADRYFRTAAALPMPKDSEKKDG